MKRERFTRKSLFIETYRDYQGRFYCVWKPHVSMYFSDQKELLRWLKWPKGTPTRTELDLWLEAISATDAARAANRDTETSPESGLSPELVSTGFGPEVFGATELDEGDPTLNTQMVI
jgi:hypothetical protein